MEIRYYPDKEHVAAAKKVDDPLLILIANDEKRMLMAPMDDSFDHVILLKRLGFSEGDIGQYFRVVLNKDGADWTFVCPGDYKNIPAKQKRIERFYNDGFDIIAKGIKKMGYSVPIEIPKRFRRHFNMLKNGDTYTG
jgi:hypothetical protein